MKQEWLTNEDARPENTRLASVYYNKGMEKEVYPVF